MYNTVDESRSRSIQIQMEKHGKTMKNIEKQQCISWELCLHCPRRGRASPSVIISSTSFSGSDARGPKSAEWSYRMHHNAIIEVIWNYLNIFE